jgi:hypothetical protein
MCSIKNEARCENAMKRRRSVRKPIQSPQDRTVNEFITNNAIATLRNYVRKMGMKMNYSMACHYQQLLLQAMANRRIFMTLWGDNIMLSDIQLAACVSIAAKAEHNFPFDLSDLIGTVSQEDLHKFVHAEITLAFKGVPLPSKCLHITNDTI